MRDADGAESVLDADACFVFIGASPRTDWLEGVVARDERGFILAGPDAQAAGWPLQRDPYLLETSVPGVFVAGDVRARSIKRVASAVGEGSMAVSLIHEYLVGRMSRPSTAPTCAPVDLFDDLDDAELGGVGRGRRAARRRAGRACIAEQGEPTPGRRCCCSRARRRR